MNNFPFMAAKPLSQRTVPHNKNAPRAKNAEAVFLIVLNHNHRTDLKEEGYGSIDPARTPDNIVLLHSASASVLATVALEYIRQAGITPRKNATLGIEIVFSLRKGSPIEHEKYFKDAIAWADRYFGVPILSAVIHNDQDHPHCHAVLVPVKGGKLIGSELLGDRAKIKSMQRQFFIEVAECYGLSETKPKKRHTATIRRQAVKAARHVLEVNSGLSDAVLNALLEPHFQNPEPLLLVLGLAMPNPKPKGTFVGIMTKPINAKSPNRTFSQSATNIQKSPNRTFSKAKKSNVLCPVIGHCFPPPNTSTSTTAIESTGQAVKASPEHQAVPSTFQQYAERVTH